MQVNKDAKVVIQKTQVTEPDSYIGITVMVIVIDIAGNVFFEML